MADKFPKRMLPIDNIEATAATQIRVRKDPVTIKAYAEDIKNGAKFPAIVVFCEQNSERYILADGFHRIHAFVDAGVDSILAEVRPGGMREALIYALGANHDHGLRLGNADKRNAVLMALKDPEISQLSLRDIADICRVSHMTVARIRNELAFPTPEPDSNGHNQEGEAPTDPSDDDRLVKREATQAEVETREVAEACKVFKALPYWGKDAGERLLLDDDLVESLEYVSAWCADVVIDYRRAKKDA
jgi:hypothetical protein